MVYELRYKHRIGQWPDVAPLVDGLPARLADLGFDLIAADAATMDLAGGFDWSHRDPFDRVIAATSISTGRALVSKDATLDTVPGGLTRVW